MKATIEAISPGGYVIRFEIDVERGLEPLLQRLADLELGLQDANYEPTGELPHTPDGLPICRRHGIVMKQREKQGDIWYSHVRIVGGQEIYCKGRPGKDSPGWEL